MAKLLKLFGIYTHPFFFQRFYKVKKNHDNSISGKEYIFYVRNKVIFTLKCVNLEIFDGTATFPVYIVVILHHESGNLKPFNVKPSQFTNCVAKNRDQIDGVKVSCKTARSIEIS